MHPSVCPSELGCVCVRGHDDGPCLQEDQIHPSPAPTPTTREQRHAEPDEQEDAGRQDARQVRHLRRVGGGGGPPGQSVSQSGQGEGVGRVVGVYKLNKSFVVSLLCSNQKLWLFSPSICMFIQKNNHHPFGTGHSRSASCTRPSSGTRSGTLWSTPASVRAWRLHAACMCALGGGWGAGVRGVLPIHSVIVPHPPHTHPSTTCPSIAIPPSLPHPTPP